MNKGVNDASFRTFCFKITRQLSYFRRADEHICSARSIILEPGKLSSNAPSLMDLLFVILHPYVEKDCEVSSRLSRKQRTARLVMTWQCKYLSTLSPQGRRSQITAPLDRPRRCWLFLNTIFYLSRLCTWSWVSELEFKNTARLPGSWNVFLVLDARWSWGQMTHADWGPRHLSGHTEEGLVAGLSKKIIGNTAWEL